jgi:Protein of unknown function (DUF2889)
VPVPALTAAPTNPATAPPPRRPGSVRRTSTVLMSWPDGLGTDLHLKGRARDLHTPRDSGDPVVVSHSDLYAVTGRERDILRIEADPAPAGLERLVGSRAGGNLRKAIAAELPEEVANGTPLHLLLDDLAGSTLISGFVFVRWLDHLPEMRERFTKAQPNRQMVDICSGFQSGSSALRSDGSVIHNQNIAHPGPLADPTDPLGWHELDEPPVPAMRRARRIDVWDEGGTLGIDAMFRDSAWDPDGSEVVVHEYQLLGQADQASGVLQSITAVPRVLPYAECPGAAPNASWMAGTELRAMRTEVLTRLRKTDCCTHLNDGLRSLAEVPVLAAALSR